VSLDCEFHGQHSAGFLLIVLHFLLLALARASRRTHRADRGRLSNAPRQLVLRKVGPAKR
jgi:hypothetical protein